MKTSPTFASAIIICCAAVLLCGCNTGKNNLIFVTKTSYGLDIDRSPPTFEVAFGRKEGMLGPVYGNGANLPVLASFHSDGGLLRTSVGQSFATGQSAELLARYLGTDATLTNDAAIPGDEITGKATVDVADGVPKRHFFGTATIFGLKIQFAEETGYIPDSVSIGYKRKEVALVSLSVEGEGAEKQVSLPSLVATHGSSLNTAGVSNTTSSINQFFATGRAADYLMARREIRDTIGFRVINDRELRAKMMKEEETFTEQTTLVGNIQRSFTAVTSDAKRDLIRTKAVNLGLINPTTTNSEFPGNLSDAVKRSNPRVGRQLQELDAFANALH